MVSYYLEIPKWLVNIVQYFGLVVTEAKESIPSCSEEWDATEYDYSINSYNVWLYRRINNKSFVLNNQGQLIQTNTKRIGNKFPIIPPTFSLHVNFKNAPVVELV